MLAVGVEGSPISLSVGVGSVSTEILSQRDNQPTNLVPISANALNTICFSLISYFVEFCVQRKLKRDHLKTF